MAASASMAATPLQQQQPQQQAAAGADISTMILQQQQFTGSMPFHHTMQHGSYYSMPALHGHGTVVVPPAGAHTQIPMYPHPHPDHGIADDADIFGDLSHEDWDSITQLLAPGSPIPATGAAASTAKSYHQGAAPTNMAGMLNAAHPENAAGKNTIAATQHYGTMDFQKDGMVHGPLPVLGAYAGAAERTAALHPAPSLQQDHSLQHQLVAVGPDGTHYYMQSPVHTQPRLIYHSHHNQQLEQQWLSNPGSFQPGTSPHAPTSGTQSHGHVLTQQQQGYQHVSAHSHACGEMGVHAHPAGSEGSCHVAGQDEQHSGAQHPGLMQYEHMPVNKPQFLSTAHVADNQALASAAEEDEAFGLGFLCSPPASPTQQNHADGYDGKCTKDHAEQGRNICRQPESAPVQATEMASSAQPRAVEEQNPQHQDVVTTKPDEAHGTDGAFAILTSALGSIRSAALPERLQLRLADIQAGLSAWNGSSFAVDRL